MTQSLRETIEKGRSKLGLELNTHQIDQLVLYVEHLERWNRSFNLTSIRDPIQMVKRHLLDSLAIAPYVAGERLIDIGTGGGLPGIPLAICFPLKTWFLLDSNGKKTRFLTQMKGVLGLSTLDVVHSRAELFRPDEGYDVILSRAFAKISDMIEVTAHLLKPGGRFYAMKAGGVDDELQDLPDGYQVDRIIELKVPGLENEQRHLVIIRRN